MLNYHHTGVLKSKTLTEGFLLSLSTVFRLTRPRLMRSFSVYETLSHSLANDSLTSSRNEPELRESSRNESLRFFFLHSSVGFRSHLLLLLLLLTGYDG